MIRYAMIGLTALAMIGCNGPIGRWSNGHTSLISSQQRSVIDMPLERIVVTEDTAESMRWSSGVQGFAIIATSEFTRETPLDNDLGAANSPLRRRASSLGANYVRWRHTVEPDPHAYTGELHHYRAIFYRGLSSPLPLAAALESFQPSIRVPVAEAEEEVEAPAPINLVRPKNSVAEVPVEPTAH